MKLSVLVLTLLVCGVSAPTFQATVDNSQTETSNTLCVVDVTGLPVPVRFEKSITLTEAIKQAGIHREDIKNTVWILSRRQDGPISPTKLDFKKIEKGATDFSLGQHDMVYVQARRKQSPANLEAIANSCAICGCKLMPLMHGGIVPLPREWSTSSTPAEKNLDPNNQNP